MRSIFGRGILAVHPHTCGAIQIPGASGRLVGPTVFKTAAALYPQCLVGSIPIRSRPFL